MTFFGEVVAASGVVASTRYDDGVALRFARARRYWPDKVVGEADTISAVRALEGGGGASRDLD